MILLLLLLGVAVALYLALRHWSRRQRASLGLEQRTIVAADDTRLGAPTLRSYRFALVGRPDHLLRSGGALIPVEQKPTARRLQRSHVLQIAAQCLLVQEVYGVRPPYGLVVLAGGRQQLVTFTPELERRLLATMDEMRDFLESGREPGRRWVDHKCRACGYRTTCWK